MSQLIENMIDEICQFSGITRIQFFSRRRDEPIVFSRQAFCYFVRTNKDVYKLTLEEVGKITCKSKPQDHATIKNAVRRFQERLDTRDESSLQIIRLLASKFPSSFVRFGIDKHMSFTGFIPFKKRPMEDSLIEVKNDIPFAIGFYDSAENCVRSHGIVVNIQPEFEWRYYL